MKKRVPPTLDGLISAAKQHVPTQEALSVIAERTAARVPVAPSLFHVFRSRAQRHPALATAMVVVSLGATIVTTRALDIGAHAPSNVDVSAAPQRSTPEATDTVSSPSPSPAVRPSSDETALGSIDTAPAIPSGAAESATNTLTAPSIDVGSLPTSAPSAAAPNTRPTPMGEPTESGLLQKARAAMDANPQSALALTTEHERRFPKGMLAQEREVLAIEALARLGRHAEARSRARNFSRSYPDSAYRPRIDEALRERTNGNAAPTEDP